ncbi:MAG: FecR domain-containing protein [Burkholderiales bacterium]|nr:FecR domain-containing protein [Burkholderiales bacterium]
MAAAALLLAWPALAQRAAEEEWSYRIERGDTLIGLHERLMRPEASWRAVQRLNRVADPHRLRPGSVLRIPLAFLREEAASAEVLHAHGEVWLERAGTERQALTATAPVRVGDSVVTGAQSSVSLRFADGSRTQLGPNGRLLVERHVRLGASGSVDTRLRLEAGGAEAQVPTTAAATAPAAAPTKAPAAAARPTLPAARFEMRTPVVNLGVRGTEFRGRVDGGRTLAEVLQGRVAAGPQTLDAGFGTVATATGVAPPRPLLAAPDLAGVPARIERVPLQLPLPPLSTAEGARALRAQVFDTAEVPRLLLDGLFEQPLAAWTDDLPDGNYELRVRASDGDGVEGRPARRLFMLKARPEPPFLLRPRAGEKVTDEQVTLAWARNPQAARYRVQVAPQADFAAPSLQRDDIDGTDLSLPLPLGVHHWRVAAVRADGDTGPWSDAQMLDRVERPPPPPPPSAPGSQKAQAAAEGIVVNWAAAPLAGASYQVQIARDAAFTQIVLDERSTRTEALLPKPDAGTYHVRVRTIGADGRAGAFGGAQVIEVPRSWWWLWLLPLLLLF